MIRLELGSRRHALGRRILMVVNFAALAVVAVGAAIWLDGRYGLLETWSSPPVVQPDGVDSRDDSAPRAGSEQGMADSPGEKSQQGRDEGISQRRDQGILKERDQGILKERDQGISRGRDQATSKRRDQGISQRRDQGSPRRRNQSATQIPQQSDLCLRAVEQYGRLPASLIPFTSLNSESSGEYTFEGLKPARKLADLFDFLNELQRIPSRPTFSYWQEGASPGERPYAFAFRGVLEESPDGKPLNSLTSSEAQSLLDGVARRARRSGLGQVTVTDSVGLQLTPTTVRLRPKLRAIGTYEQINSFAVSLRELAAELTLGQLAMVPIRDGAAGRMQLSASLEMLVSTSEASVGGTTADDAM